MKKFDLKYIPFIVLFALSMALAPVFRAQDLGSITRITPVPDGAIFTVDGQTYSHTASAVWPAGSKHTLFVGSTIQVGGHLKARYTFNGWEFAGGSLLQNPLIITASSAIPEYKALFTVEYALSIIFFDCPDPLHCASPGTIYVNGAPINSTADVFVGSATLQAVPNPGYVFVGWLPGAHQAIAGFQNTVTINEPTSVYPVFQVARRVNFTTVPANLLVLADRAQMPTPTFLEWGWDTTHSVGPVSPQQDVNGKWWAFQSWSDGGADNHAYKVAPFSTPDTITATYVAAANVSVITQPVGLKIKVDGRENVVYPYYFNWGVGETHHLEAPAQQTDAQGRVWSFSGWSNGVTAAAQDFTVPLEADTGGARLTATYTQLAKLTVNSSLSALSVSVDGTACATPCEILRPLRAQVRVSAPQSVVQGDNSRADFNGWTGGAGELVLTLGEDAQTVSANYHMMNRLSSSSEPVNGAVWSVLPASTDGYYDAKSMVAVSLASQPGFRFRRWDGDLSGTIPSGVVAMTAPRRVRALFDTIPYLAPAGVGNAAGVTPQPGVAGGSVVSVFGANLALDTVLAPEGMVPQTLGGVTARVGDRLLPLFFVSPSQMNVQLPDDVASGAQLLTISSQGQPDVRTDFTVVRNAPGLFPVVFHEDGSVVTADSPAKRGELVTVYGTGFGPADHPRPEGFAIPRSPAYLIVDSASVQVGDAVIAAEKAFAVPGRTAIDAVQFRVPDSATSDATLRVTINGQDSNTLQLPVAI
jgi:uncharacterized protein (TIGR03437 family)